MYIHIPFCYKKCPYCSFVSYEKHFCLLDDYAKALVKQIRNFNDRNYTVKTVYFGGGTPTILKVKHLEAILRAIDATFNLDLEEITIETIPNNVKFEYTKALKSLGFNRLSIGIQSFRDEKLKILGRIHESKESFKAIETAFKSGFDNISIDLIYGIEDSLVSLEKEIDIAMNLPIKHVSAYLLTIEEKTEFFELKEMGKLKLSDDDFAAELYSKLCEKLESRGFMQYEISNFAKSGYHSKHNISYWTGKEYIGFGVSAASFLKRKRFKVTDNLKKFINNPTESFLIEESLSNDDLIKEMFILGLRLKNGIDVIDFREKYGVYVFDYFGDELQNLIDMGFLKFKNNRIFLNGCEAMFVSNSIFSELI